MSRYLDILRLRPFRLFWLGFTFSIHGDQLTKVALVWFVYEQTQSAEAVGLLMVCFTGPIILGGFLAGWALDRFDRRAILILDNLLRAAAIGAIPVLHLMDALALWHIYAAAAIYGLLLMIPLAGTPALIPALVPADRIATANALEMLGYTLGGVAGPALGGAIIAAVGAPAAVALDAASYLFFAWCLWRMGKIAGAPPPASPAARRTGGFGAAAQLLFGHPVLGATTLMYLAWNIGGGIIAVALPILAAETLKGGPELYGVLVAIEAAGQMASTLIVGALAAGGWLGRRICLIQATSGLALLALALSGQHVALVGLAQFAYGVCAAPMTIWAQTLRMAIVPAEMRGRAFALMRMLMQSGRPIGGALGGLLLSAIGPAAAMLLAAALAGVPGVAGLSVPALRKAEIRKIGRG